MPIKNSKEDHITRLADYANSKADWKGFHTEFIITWFSKYKSFLKRLLKTPNEKKAYVAEE